MATANPSLTFSTSTNVLLSLEDFHNAGMTREETKEVIERIQSPDGMGRLHCSTGGCNGNWKVNVYTSHYETIYDLVDEIHWALTTALRRKETK